MAPADVTSTGSAPPEAHSDRPWPHDGVSVVARIASGPNFFTAPGRSLALHTWRRHHGSEIVAEVAPGAGFSTWHASAWRISNPVVRRPRQFTVLMSAQAAADRLARNSFDHICDLDTCGVWMFWPRG
jgi:hypothetical protein